MRPEATDWRAALGALLPEDATIENQPTEESPVEKTPLQKLRIDIERKGRGGKTATIISGFTIDDQEIEAIAGTLKKKLGTGGSARGGEILIQGDRREDVRKVLKDMGIIK